MATPHRCPLCNGKGSTLPTDFEVGGWCRACSGSGIVWEQVETVYTAVSPEAVEIPVRFEYLDNPATAERDQ